MSEVENKLGNELDNELSNQLEKYELSIQMETRLSIVIEYLQNQREVFEKMYNEREQEALKIVLEQLNLQMLELWQGLNSMEDMLDSGGYDDAFTDTDVAEDIQRYYENRD